MYVVRRTFRNCGKMLTPGSVVEPGSVKHFKSRLRDRVIIEVTEHDFDRWNEYFKNKLGVAIQLPTDNGEGVQLTMDGAADNPEQPAGESFESVDNAEQSEMVDGEQLSIDTPPVKATPVVRANQ